MHPILKSKQGLSVKNVVCIVIIILSVMLMSCSPHPRRACENPTITMAGSSTVYPISLAMAQAYKKIHANPTIDIHLSSTGEGFHRFSEGQIDIALASRPIKTTEMSQCESNGIRFFELPVGYDAIAIVVNHNNTWARDITTSELAKIWSPDSEGRVTHWNQIRADWPDKPLHLVGPDKNSGTFDYFTKAIVGKAGSSRSDYQSSQDDKLLVRAVSGDPYAMGYFGLSYYLKNTDHLKTLPVDDKDDSNGPGPQLPSQENVINKTYQPLSRPLFIYVSQAAAEQVHLRDFVKYFLNNTQQIVSNIQSVPLSDEVMQTTCDRFSHRISGTAFEGKGSVIGLSMDQLLEMSLEELMNISIQ